MDVNEFETDYPEVDFASLIYCEEGLWGVRESALTCGLPAIYDSIECWDNSNSYMVWKDGLVGLVCLEECANWVFEAVYMSIQQIDMCRFLLCREGKFFYWREGKVTDWGADEYVLPELAGWISVRRGDEWGYLDGDLKFTTDKGRAHEYVFPKKLFNRGCRLIQRSDLDNCTSVDGLANNGTLHIFCEDGRYGMKDFLDYTVIQPTYDDIRWTYDGNHTAMGCKDGMWGVVACWGRVEDEPQLIYDSFICDSSKL